MGVAPADDHEWTIHSINIHGVFFERWCQSVIAKLQGWSVTKTNYPVAFPPPHYSFHTKESSLDIAAEHSSHRRTLLLLIECKKNNPEFVNWVFFPKRHQSESNLFYFHQLEMKRYPEAEGSYPEQSFGVSAPGFVIADEARETRTSYSDHKRQDKTKTSNAAISDAARQVALATQALAFEEIERVERHGRELSRLATPGHHVILVPMIVTTARLSTCTFDPTEVEPTTGEIDFAKATLNECPLLIYEYPIPRPLQFDLDDFRSPPQNIPLDPFVKMHIVVIQSDHLSNALPTLGAEFDL